MDYEKPMITPVDTGGDEIMPTAWLALAVLIIVVLAGGYGAAVYSWLVGVALGGVGAVWYATISMSCVSAE